MPAEKLKSVNTRPPAMPTQVKIGAQVFDIVERSRKKDGMLNDETYGYTIDKENLIVVDADIHITKKQVTLLHEIMHACRLVFDNGLKPKKIDEFDVWEHYFIGAWETSLIMVFRDNPKVLTYLIWE